MISLSVQTIIIIAFLSALSRAGLNVVDRYQIGLKKVSILQVNFWNNVVPALFLMVLCLLLSWSTELYSYFFDVRSFVFSLLAQVVAYAFSYAFRHMDVSQVLITSKLSDVIIPIGIFATTMYWDWSNYYFSIATTLVCLLVLLDKDKRFSLVAFRKIIAVIILSLLIQASFSPLVTVIGTNTSIQDAVSFTTAVIMWRVVWSFIPMVRFKNLALRPDVTLLFSPIFNIRVILTVFTQLTFILAVSSPISAVAWPILNATPLLAILLSRFFLKEGLSRIQVIIILLITALSIIRVFIY